RQTASLTSAAPDNIGSFSFGRGVDLNSVTRTVDPMLNQAQLTNSSQLAYWKEVNSGLVNIENIFGSLQSTGLSSALDNFFQSWQQLANNPQDGAQRVNVRANASMVVTNLSNMNQQMLNTQATTNTRIDQVIGSANSILDNIASLTIQINRQEIGSQGVSGMANDLRDQRDQAVRDLSAIIPVQEVSTRDGSFMLQTVNGDLLSQDGVARHLARGAAVAGSFAEVTIAESGQPLSGALTSGTIGGLIDLRDNKIGTYIQQLNSIAANLIFSTNQIHASGTGLTGVTTLSAEQASNTILPLNDPTQTAPFASKIQSGSFQIHVYDAAGTATPAGGTAINITAGVTNMNDIASSLNAVTGITATIDGTGHLNISAAAGSTFRLSDDSSNMLAAYEINTFFHGANAASLSVSSTIQNNASAMNAGRVDLATSASNIGDNTAATAILALQNLQLSVDGTPSFSLHERTASLSTQYGTDVSISAQQLNYRTAESDSLTSQRQAIAGVNVDEELIQMIKFQRAYESSAKIITTTNQMLDSLLGLIR
ncbi:MAG: flagellar hook-associated protein FlgK, partial [Zetaproteobacteria bacterium CG_4_9_14_3_um_filter_53_7]